MIKNNYFLVVIIPEKYMNRMTLLVIMLAWFSGCGQASQEYFPLGENIRWEYVIEEQVNDEKKILKSIVTGLKSRTIEGLTYYPLIYASGEIYYFRKSTDGIIVTPKPGQPGNIILGFPLEVGTDWKTETQLGILHHRHESFSGGESFISLGQDIILDFHIAGLDETVDVPAGKFFNCMRIDGIGTVKVEARTRGLDHILIEQTDWYARGTGLVKRIRTEASIPEKYRGTHTQELVAIKR